MDKHVMEKALRELNPVAQPQGPGPVDEMLLARLLATPTPAAGANLAGRRRRRALALGGAGVLAVGVGAAAAAGVLPDRFVEVFPWMEAFPSTGSEPTLVAVVAGPWGSELRYFESVSDDGTICLNHVRVDPGQESDAEAEEDALLNAKEWTAGGLCTDDKAGPLVADAAGGPWYYDVTGTAGDAVMADVTVGDGTVYPVTIADGWLMGWFGAEPGETAVLTGYDRDGQPVRSILLAP